MIAQLKYIGRRWRKRLVLVLMAMTAAVARALPPAQEEPQWLSFRLNEGYLRLDAEGEQDSFSSSNGGNPAKNQLIYLAPAIGIGGVGSIYHPDLFSFSLKAEPGYVWQQSGPPGGQMSEMNSFLQSYDFSGTFLQAKPYSSTLFANASHNIQQYSFFSSAVVDNQTWGANLGYTEGPVPVSLRFTESHQDLSGLSQDSSYDQTTIDLRAHNDRANHSGTELMYFYGQENRTTTASGESFKDDDSYHYLTLTDVERGDKSTLNSSFLYNHTESQDTPSDSLDAHTDLNLDHTEHLHTSYGYAFDYYDDTISDAYQHYIHTGIQHQLFESLSSSLDLHGGLSQSSSPGSSLEVQGGGVLESESYVKRLGAWGRLTLGNSAGFDVTSQSSSGSGLQIPRESHALNTTPDRLVQPRDLAIESVTTDAVHGYLPLQENLDYIVDRTVDPWTIRIAPGSLNVNPGDTVLVTYTVQLNPSGSYTTLSEIFQVRLELFQRLLALYTRFDFIDHHTDQAGFVLENVSEFQTGVDFNWHRLNLGANYTERHSSIYDYDSTSLYEAYSLIVLPDSTLSLNFRQQWSESPDQHQKNTYYDFMARYDWRVNAYVHWTTEGGFERQRGSGADQDLTTARTHLDWIIGRLSFHLGYEYQGQDFSGETRQRHLAFLRFRRNF